MQTLRLFTLTIFTFLSFSVFSSQTKIIEDSNKRLLVQITSSYVLGDGDTRIDGKNIALQHAKKAAAEAAGSYIEAQKHIVDDTIKSDSIKIISTALLSTKILKEDISLTKDQRTRVELLVEANLDKESLMAKLGTLKNNDHKKQQILQLKQDNEGLRNELAALNKKIASLTTEKKASVVKKPRPELVERRDQVLSKIENNEASIRKVFSKGTLFSLAKKSSRDYENAKQDIESNVWKYIKQNLQLNVGEPRFKDNGNNTYDVEVPISWKLDSGPVLETINKYFWSYRKRKLELSRESRLEILERTNKDDRKKLAYSDKLFSYLRSNAVFLELSASNYKSHVRVAGCTDTFVSTSAANCPKGNGYMINFNLKETESSFFDSNPVVIENVPVSVLENLTSIDAKVVLR